MSELGRALLLAYYFPPATGIASERLAGFHRHLPDLGWGSWVVAPRDPHFHQSREEKERDPQAVVRTGSLELSRLFRAAVRGLSSSSHRNDQVEASSRGGDALGGEEMDLALTPLSGGPLVSLGRRLLREHVYVPDAQIGWVPFAIRAGARILESRLDGGWVVFSSSVPYSAHLAAARLSRRFRLPWVAEFRDPWTAQDPSLHPSSPFRRSLDRRLEGWILKEAQRVVVTSARTRGLISEHFPEVGNEKVAVVPNGFEPERTGRIPSPSDPMLVVHAGTVQDPEYLRPLLKAVVRLHESRPDCIRIVSYGDKTPWLRILDEIPGGIPSWVKLEGIRSPGDAARGMNEASALLLMYPDTRFERVISGKLFSYLGARRPILGVVPSGSEMERLIQDAGDGWMLQEWTESAIREKLEALLGEHRAGRIQAPRVPESIIAHLTRRARTEELVEVFRSALTIGRPG